ncbi:MAG: hypothetical protein KDC24_04620 [Saprospiraceae bacterium]|nr:hypothetical protein [Saprospiraceae bacterium]
MNQPLDDGFTNAGELHISNEIKFFLQTIAKWAKFLSILGFVGIGLMVLLSFSIGAIMATLGSYSPTPMPASSGFLPVVYIIGGAIQFFPVYYLFQFSKKMKIALDASDQSYLTGAFDYLKRHYVFIGIVALIFTIIYGLFIVMGLLAALIGFAM